MIASSPDCARERDPHAVVPVDGNASVPDLGEGADAGPPVTGARAKMAPVATGFQHQQSFNGAPADVMAMLRHPDYIREKCDRTGSMETTVAVTDTDDGGCVITTTRVLPAQVPAAAKRFVGETLTVTEVQTWTPLGPDGTATATGDVDFGAPLAFRASLTLAPGGDGTTVTTDGSFKASVPFVGGTIEKGAAEQTAKYLTVEERVGNEWLSR